jgi:serine-type D-Ala-D-Ala carboxypeptidase/endopeptidase (penicillin-binding protein 4)
MNTIRLATFVLLCQLLIPDLVLAESRISQGHDPRLQSVLGEVLHRHDDSGAIIAARVIELKTGRELYAERIDEPFIPASNMKVPVSATLIDTFGADHTFETYLAIDGDDLWIIGTGDPGIGDPRIAREQKRTPTSVFDDWAEALKKRGITEIKGDLYYYDGALDNQLVHPLWRRGFLTDWYAAPVSGLNFNDNCIDVTVHPTEPGQPVRVEVMPPTQHMVIVNECVTGEEHKPTITRERASDVFTISGTAAKRAELSSKPVTDPGAFFADALRTHLDAAGIRIAGETKRADKPLDGKLEPGKDQLVAVHETAMNDVLRRINKNSQNMFAEAAAKLAGQEYARRQGREIAGSWMAGAEAVRNGIDHSGLHVTDGSGLERSNRVTSRLMTDLLVVMWKHPHGKMWRESLTISGRDGTIGSRLKDIEGRVYAKTGFIGGVRSLSGYVHTRDGQWLVFSFIFNRIPGDVKPFEAVQDDACRVLYEWPNLKAPPATVPGGATGP